MRYCVPFQFICILAEEWGARSCHWRESDRAFTGFVAEVAFSSATVAADFARRWSEVVGYGVAVRHQCGFHTVSVPCAIADEANLA